MKGGIMAQATAERVNVRTIEHTHTETRKSFRTTEFYAMVLFVAGVLLATYLDEDSLARTEGWRYASFAVVAYLISRGLAKVGTREPRTTDVGHTASDTK
jgi:hypothetical protein